MAAKTVLTYPLTGGRDFPIAFEYLARKFVQVSLKGSAGTLTLTLNTDYRFTGKNQITTTQTLVPNGEYDTIEIRRYTSATERLVDFNDGSILRAYDLNLSQIQTLHVAEEARDLTADTIGVNDDGDLDARNRRIVNVADGVNELDAVNVKQLFLAQGSAGQSAAAAKASELAAKASELAAAESQRLAANSATTAVTSADTAVAAATGAIDARDVAITKATEAEASAVSAKEDAIVAGIFKTEAEASKVQAKVEADRSRAEADRAWEAADVAGEPEYAVQIPPAVYQSNYPTSGTLEAGRSNGATTVFVGQDSFAMPMPNVLTPSGANWIFYPQDLLPSLPNFSLSFRVDHSTISGGMVLVTLSGSGSTVLEFGVHADGRVFVRNPSGEVNTPPNSGGSGFYSFSVSPTHTKIFVGGATSVVTGDSINWSREPLGCIIHDPDAVKTRNLRLWPFAFNDLQLRGLK